MRSPFFRRFLLTLSLLTLIGCNTDLANDADSEIESAASSAAEALDKRLSDELAADKQTDTAAQPPDTKDRPKPIMPAIAPGEYCYESESDTKGLSALIEIDSSDRVTGSFQGVIQDEKNAYYTSYRQKLNGTIDGSNLNLDVATWIEFDRQNSQETWKVTSKGLSTERDTLSLVSCETVKANFETDGLKAEDLTKSANNVREMEVFFEAGTSDTTLSNAVVRGDRDLYTLTAQGGQTMALSISSLEDNAAFDIISPSGTILSQETVEESLYLPETGRYEIIVGGTRGNATYDLEIEIE